MTELKYMYSMMQVRIDRSGECAYCDEIQILLVLDGKMTMNLNGKRMELLSDDLVFLNIGDRYSFPAAKYLFCQCYLSRGTAGRVCGRAAGTGFGPDVSGTGKM